MITKNDINKLFEEKLRNKLTEEQSESDTITGLVNPFVGLLGYTKDEWEDYRREYKSPYAGGSDPVDIALMKGKDNPIIVIECKKYGHRFTRHNVTQLHKYYTSAKSGGCEDLSLGILTDGDLYKIFSETRRANCMDDKPFVEFKVSEFDLCPDSVIDLINLMHKDRYNQKLIIDHAYQNIYLKGIQETLLDEFNNPTEEFTRFLVKPLMPNNTNLTSAKVKEFFNPLVFQATQQFKNSLTGSDDIISPTPSIVTTETEVNGYRVLLSLFQDSFDIERLTHEDTWEGFFLIMIDGNPNKIVCRFWFDNESDLKIGLYGESSNEVSKKRINSVEDIKQYKDELLERVRFLEPSRLEPDKEPKNRKITHPKGVYEGMSMQQINNGNIEDIPWGEGTFYFNNGRERTGIWKSWKLDREN